MNIPREYIDLLLAKIDIVDLINTYLTLRKKSGSNYFARCPFHNEKSASFSVSQPKQFYYCFGCGAHGNAIDFLMQHDRLSFPEAIEHLSRQAGMEMPQAGTSVSPNKTESTTQLFDLNACVSKFYYEQLTKSTRAIDYLKKRGIAGVTAKLFQLGYASPAWDLVLQTFGKTKDEEKTLSEVGLTIRKENGGAYDRFRDRILFPIHDHRGRVIGFGGRILDQGEPKYLNSPETPLFQKGHELYGLYQALKANRKFERMLIVEGYMDVIALFQQGITYAVATLGTATTAYHINKIYRYTADIIFCFDGDEAGRTAAWRALQVALPIMQDNMQIRFLFLPDGEDPDSLVRKEGKVAFEERIISSTSLADFFFKTLSAQGDMSTMEGRARFAANALTFINQIPAGIYPGILIDELSKRARVDVNELKQQLKNPVQTDTPGTMTQKSALPSKIPPALRLAMTLLVQYPHLASSLTDPVPGEATLGLNFFKRLIEIARAEPHMTTGALIERWRGQKEYAFIAKLGSEETLIPESGVEKEFLGAIKQLSVLAIDEEINRLLAKVAQEGLIESEKQELANWIVKKKQLNP